MKLIKIDGYWIIVSNEKGYDNCICLLNNQIYRYTEAFGKQHTGETRQVLFSQNPEHNLPSITFSDEVAKELGIVDIEKLGENSFNMFRQKNPIVPQKYILPHKLGFIKGYNQALSDNKDKLFTLEDFNNFILYLSSYHYQAQLQGEKLDFSLYQSPLESFIQSLTKQEYNCELEMDRIPADRAPNGWDIFPKIINNSVKVINLLK